jgi:MHS family proline/betaine transporter-like MFS transporter
MVVAFGQGCVALLIPLMGKIADAWNGRKLLLLGLIGAAIAAPLVFLLGMMHSIFLALCAQLIYALFNAMTGAPVFNYINSLFPTERRYTGTTVAWSVSVAIFAGTAPMVAEYWVGTLHFIQGPGLYVSVSALIAFVILSLRFIRINSESQVALSLNNLP